MKNNNRFTLRLSDKQLNTLKEAARAERRTAAAIVRNLIDDLEKEEVQSKICKAANLYDCFNTRK